MGGKYDMFFDKDDYDMSDNKFSDEEYDDEYFDDEDDMEATTWFDSEEVKSKASNKKAASKKSKKNSKTKKPKKERTKGQKRAIIALKVVLSIFLVGLISGMIVVGAFFAYMYDYLDIKALDKYFGYEDDSDYDELFDLMANLDFTTTVYVKNSVNFSHASAEAEKVNAQNNTGSADSKVDSSISKKVLDNGNLELSADVGSNSFCTWNLSGDYKIESGELTDKKIEVSGKNITAGATFWVAYQRLHSSENRIWVDSDTIPDNLKNAFVAIEDKRFYKHSGVDWKRTFGAFANMFFSIYSSEQGGSTITQQLVKNITGDSQQTSARKIREIKRAIYIEKNYSKETILEYYLNTISFANGIYGVEVASNYYFGKSVSDLSVAECATLAAMVKAPETYRPDIYPENNQKRRNSVLYQMNDQGYITDKQYKAAKDEMVTITADKTVIHDDKVNSYYIDAIIDEVIGDLAEENNWDTSYASTRFYNGGYKIYCAMDSTVQTTMETVYKDGSFFSEKNSKGIQCQSCMTLTDYEGHIVGIVGGIGEKTTNRGLNRATSSPRQPGSTMKPLAAYALAIDNDDITYSSMLEDTAYSTLDGAPWPKNWYNSYNGKVTVQKALERSINTIPVKLVNETGLQTVYDFLHDDLGLTDLDDKYDVNSSSLGLGGTYTGVTTTQSAAAFAIFGNGGKYYSPTTYCYIEDSYGTLVLGNRETLKGKGKQVIGEDTACIMNHLLQGVVYGPQGTGTGAASYNDMTMYAKTGTSNDANDNWFVGCTPYYVGSCWYGYDEMQKVRNTATCRKLWVAVMKQLHASLPYKEFEESDDVVELAYCKSTGLPAKSGCGSTAIGYYKTSDLKYCTTHGGKELGEEAIKGKSKYYYSSGSHLTSSSQTSSTETASISSATTSKVTQSTAQPTSSASASSTTLQTPADTEQTSP